MMDWWKPLYFLLMLCLWQCFWSLTLVIVVLHVLGGCVYGLCILHGRAEEFVNQSIVHAEGEVGYTKG